MTCVVHMHDSGSQRFDALGACEHVRSHHVSTGVPTISGQLTVLVGRARNGEVDVGCLTEGSTVLKACDRPSSYCTCSRREAVTLQNNPTSKLVHDLCRSNVVRNTSV